MTRFGKLFAAILVLCAIGIASMVRFRDAPPVQAPPPAGRTTDDADGAAAVALLANGLAVPVAGVRPAELRDTFGDARTGHVHGALDIMAARGTPVVAAFAGRVEKIFESGRGGHTVYLRAPDDRWIGYYAHLDRYAPGLAEGQRVARGAPIGTVGFSGNADPAGPHLHFEIRRMAPGEPWHGGRAINPYRVLAPQPERTAQPVVAPRAPPAA